MENIKIIRMKAGYDLIGFVSEDLTHQVHIKKPMKIGIQVDPRDQQQFFVIQNWLPHQYFSQDEVNLWQDDIMFIVEATESFKEYYVEMLHKLDKLITAVSILDAVKDSEEIMNAMDESINQTLH
jgi:hypothetical protein